jgi:hypothetical protein
VSFYSDLELTSHDLLSSPGRFHSSHSRRAIMVNPRCGPVPMMLAAGWLVCRAYSFLSSSPSYTGRKHLDFSRSCFLSMSSSTQAPTVPSWADLTIQVAATPFGRALNKEVELRKEGKGSAHVHNKLRKFDSNENPTIIFYRDHAGWYVLLFSDQ